MVAAEHDKIAVGQLEAAGKRILTSRGAFVADCLVLALDKALDRRRRRHCPAGHAVEQICRRLARNDRIRDRVGVMLVRIVRAAIDAALELYATALLHHVRSFVRGRVQVR